MPTATMFRKNDEREDLCALASDVLTSGPCNHAQGTARDAARSLAGVVSWIANRGGAIRMQEALACLVRHQAAWEAPFMRSLPAQPSGFVDEHVALLAVVVSTWLHSHRPQDLRAAMAWWATENDPAAWQAVLSSAAVA